MLVVVTSRDPQAGQTAGATGGFSGVVVLSISIASSRLDGFGSGTLGTLALLERHSLAFVQILEAGFDTR